MDDAAFPKFRQFYDSLVWAGTSRGISPADAEDIAGNAVERGLSAFDPAKGEFAAFCRTIHSNLMKNYWRDRKHMEPIEEEGPADPDPPVDPLELADTVREIRAALSEITKILSDEENGFLKNLQAVLDESGPRAISEASRRSGLTPAKGWDMFRKIQRKARGLSPRLVLDSMNYSLPLERTSRPAPARAIRVIPASPTVITKRFNPEQLRRLESLLS